MDRLVRPLRGARTITQVWGPTDYEHEPRAFGYAHFHLGVDYAAACGESVHAAGSGYVEFSGWDDTGYGLVLWLVHSGQIRSCYAHLKELLVAHGQNVTARQPIGTVGSTGNSTGCHLHFGTTESGVYVPPASLMDLAIW